MLGDDKLKQLAALGIAAGISGQQEETRREVEQLRGELARQGEEARESQRRAEERARAAEDREAQREWEESMRLETPDLLFRLTRELHDWKDASARLARDLSDANEQNADVLEIQVEEVRRFCATALAIDRRFLADFGQKQSLDELQRACACIVQELFSRLDRLTRVLAEREALRRCSAVVDFSPAMALQFCNDVPVYTLLEWEAKAHWFDEDNAVGITVAAGIVGGVAGGVCLCVLDTDGIAVPFLMFSAVVAAGLVALRYFLLRAATWTLSLLRRGLERKWRPLCNIAEHASLTWIFDQAVLWSGDSWTVREDYVSRIQKDIFKRLSSMESA